MHKDYSLIEDIVVRSLLDGLDTTVYKIGRLPVRQQLEYFLHSFCKNK